jgi:BCD family chlorophyll transporter-like MFS transporter
MSEVKPNIADFWRRVGTKFLPFADVATEDLPLGRLLRLSLFQFSVGMAAVLLTGTLNRVMILNLVFQLPLSRLWLLYHFCLRLRVP